MKRKLNGKGKKKNLVYYSNYAFRKSYFRPGIIFHYVMRIRSWRHLKTYFVAFPGFLSLIRFKKRD
ncbi:MAG: hypothetical protein ACP5NV_04185 [Candidatus Woesearchaeota archaeon]